MTMGDADGGCVGSETAIETAKEAILKIATTGNNNRSRGRRDA